MEGPVVFLCGYGRYSVRQFVSTLGTAMADPGFRPPMCLVLDCRHAVLDPPFQELQAAVDAFAHVREHFRPELHIVVASTLHYGLARIIGALLDTWGIKLKVHRYIETAREAVGLGD